ncbi:B-cell receptor CD22-like isoform X2 [Xiphias gladius]|uniref:B-cell receptor CD22-like isoform X2 n=1 Tax=Xiphias gladius TaxID=8245 RepID=UPI001A999542|nr:B-cell receptor CD22-like isoform X2 [Xiphias gladius]
MDHLQDMVLGQNNWSVKYYRTQICALKGSTVEIQCTYTTRSHNYYEKIWYTQLNVQKPVDLTTDGDYTNRVSNSCISKTCTLTLTNLKESDSAVYKFSLMRNAVFPRYSNERGVTLSVTDLKVIRQADRIYSSHANMNCLSSCPLSVDISYIWYRNGEKISNRQSSYSAYSNLEDSVSCALRGYEDFPSPPVCFEGQSCNRVTYNNRSICAFKGSSVDISCTYNSYEENVESKFWFSHKHSQEPVDLSEDSQYAGRFQVFETEEGRSTLRISDLRETDSTEYRFKFKTRHFEWRSSLPGTTLTVTDLDISVRVFPYLNLQCVTTCHQLDGSSYVWFKNGQKVDGENSYFYSYTYDYKNSYSCAVKGFENSPSLSVCFNGQSCNIVNYNHRRICALKGSSVDISCTYNSYEAQIESRFWFTAEHSHQWQNPSEPEDLHRNAQFSGRVQVRELLGRSTLTISDLRETDSAEYRFKFKTRGFEWRSSLPGTTLTVTALQVHVTRILTRRQFYTVAELNCHSICIPTGQVSYVWFKNGEKIIFETSSSYTHHFNPEDNIACAMRGYEDYHSPLVHAPQTSSVSASPSGDIVEGSSVKLTCQSDANPAANYIWYKDNQILLQGPEGFFHFTSISSEDKGIYHCKAENQFGQINSSDLFIDVQYAPKNLTVSVSPSNEVMEGSTVTLTCSSDSNPAANYTWYKENEVPPKASGQIFTITNIRPEHSGNYYCKAQNRRGHRNSKSNLTVMARSVKSAVAGSITVIFLAVIFLCAFLLIRKKRSLKQISEPRERPDNIAQLNVGSEYENSSAAVQREPAAQEDELFYSIVRFSKNQEDPLYSNISLAQPSKHWREEEEDEEGVDYTNVAVKSASATPRLRCQEAAEDPSAVYGTVKKKEHLNKV